jgi:transcriptional regulator with XRE-family HTH domain
MSERLPDLIIDPDEFPIFLKARMGTDTVQEFADKIGVTRQLVYMLALGQRKPSAAVLKAMGLKVAYVVDRSSTPAKARTKN